MHIWICGVYCAMWFLNYTMYACTLRPDLIRTHILCYVIDILVSYPLHFLFLLFQIKRWIQLGNGERQAEQTASAPSIITKAEHLKYRYSKLIKLYFRCVLYNVFSFYLQYKLLFIWCICIALILFNGKWIRMK